jgi:hypothetical protein
MQPICNHVEWWIQQHTSASVPGVLIRLVAPLIASTIFFVLAIATVRLARPKTPRLFFLAYAALLLVVSGVVSEIVWPVTVLDDAIALAACLVLQLLACLTMWNAFYSLLWGFSGTMMYELYTNSALRDRERLIRSYERPGQLDRIMARRLPSLISGGWVKADGRVLRLLPKGRLIAIGTLISYKVFSLGMGGGVR